MKRDRSRLAIVMWVRNSNHQPFGGGCWVSTVYTEGTRNGQSTPTARRVATWSLFVGRFVVCSQGCAGKLAAVCGLWPVACGQGLHCAPTQPGVRKRSSSGGDSE